MSLHRLGKQGEMLYFLCRTIWEDSTNAAEYEQKAVEMLRSGWYILRN